jgi:hypothetical protein
MLVPLVLSKATEVVAKLHEELELCALSLSLS